MGVHKANCWEFKKCGRQPLGPRVKELGLCPAAAAVSLDGVHGGLNGGRACWVVSGTFCKGEVQWHLRAEVLELRRLRLLPAGSRRGGRRVHLLQRAAGKAGERSARE